MTMEAAANIVISFDGQKQGCSAKNMGWRHGCVQNKNKQKKKSLKFMLKMTIEQ